MSYMLLYFNLYLYFCIVHYKTLCLSLIMLPVSIYINQLGALRDSKIDIYPVMIFSGESGLGKSHLALLAHYIFALLLSPLRLHEFFKKSFPYNELHPKMQGKGDIVQFSKSSLQEWMAEDAKSYLREMLRYPLLPIDVQFFLGDKIPDEFIISYEEGMSGMEGSETVDVTLSCGGLSMLASRQDLFIMQYDKESVEQESPFSFLIRHCLKKYLLDDFKRLTEDVILPPARAVALTEFVGVDKGLYKSYVDWLRPASRLRDKTPEHDSLRSFMREVIEGEVHMEDSVNYVYKKNNGVEMPITGAASSVRELAPLQFLVENDPSRAAVLLEEPETNLQAKKQRTMAELVSLLASSGTQLQITTHSDYFIRRLNELVNLGNYKGILDKKELDKLSELLHTPLELAFPSPSENLAHYMLVRNNAGFSEAVLDTNVKNGLSFETFRNTLLEGLNNADILDEYQIRNNEQESL